jgi:hypothetical protein
MFLIDNSGRQRMYQTEPQSSNDTHHPGDDGRPTQSQQVVCLRQEVVPIERELLDEIEIIGLEETRRTFMTTRASESSQGNNDSNGNQPSRMIHNAMASAAAGIVSRTFTHPLDTVSVTLPFRQKRVC